MYVFPAFNDSYKVRKRTFRCCKNCRVKRVRCIISDSSYEIDGCDNCKSQNTKCDLVKTSEEQTPEKFTEKKSANRPSKHVRGRATKENSNTVYHQHDSTPLQSPITPSASGFNPFVESSKAVLPASVRDYQREQLSGAQTGSAPAQNGYSSFQSEAGFDLPSPFGNQSNSSNTQGLQGPGPFYNGQLQDTTKRYSFSDVRSMPILPAVNLRSSSTQYACNHIDASRPNPQIANTPHSTKPVSSGVTHLTGQPIESSSASIDHSCNSEMKSMTSHSSGASLFDIHKDSLRKTAETYHILASSLEDVIDKIDYKYLKNTFDFNSTFRESEYYFAKMLSRKLGTMGEPEATPAGLARKMSAKSKFLDKSNLLQCKIVLNLHAFTLDTPGFYYVQEDDLVKLYEIYFYKVNSVYPIVFEPEFWELHKRGRIPNIIKYAVVLVAARDELSEVILARSFVNDDSFDVNNSRFLRELEMKIRQLMDFLPELGDTEKLARLITSLLLSLNFRANKIGNEQSSNDVGNSISYAYSLLIHHEFFHEQIMKVGALKKSIYLRHLWWVIFIFDRFNAILNGKAMFIKRLDFNIQRPLDSPHLNRLVLLAYALEDTLVAGFRPQRKASKSGPKFTGEFTEGDPHFDPSRLINEEVALLETTDKIEEALSLGSVTKRESKSSHLPNIPVDLYRNRFVFFLERLVHHQLILILRTGQLKDVRETSQLDHFNLRLSRSLLEMFQLLKSDQNHKLIMETALIPSAMLVAFSVPTSARSSLMQTKTENLGDIDQIMDQVRQLSEGYLHELRPYSKKWWFVRKVLESLSKTRSRENTSDKTRPNPRTHTFKDQKISIQSLVSDVADAESVLPSSLSITSPGFYDDVFEKTCSEDDHAVQKFPSNGSGQGHEANTRTTKPKFSASATSNDNLNTLASSKSPQEYFESKKDGSSVSPTDDTSIADDIHFGVAQLAEMVSLDTNFIPNVIDYFPDSQLDFFF
ncbi:hypothetical protein OXX69_002970 [Metschnikowia pulcherrima]